MVSTTPLHPVGDIDSVIMSLYVENAKQLREEAALVEGILTTRAGKLGGVYLGISDYQLENLRTSPWSLEEAQRYQVGRGGSFHPLAVLSQRSLGKNLGGIVVVNITAKDKGLVAWAEEKLLDKGYTRLESHIQYFSA